MDKDTLKIPGPLGASRHSRSLAALRRSLYPVKVLAGAVAPCAVDLVVSSALIALLSPLLLARALWSRHQVRAGLDATEVVGRYQVPFQRLAFAGTGNLRLK